MKKIALFSALLFLCAGELNAQAFGVTVGDPVTKFAGRPTASSDMAWVITVPKPNPEFETYLAYATTKSGICKVSGLGKSYKNDKYGFDVKDAFERIHSTLREKYGNSKDFDFIDSGALWKDPDEFNWSIYKEERSVASYWDQSEGSVLPRGLRSISLRIRSVDPDSSYIVINYEFSNFNDCQRVKGEKDRSGL